MDRRHFEQRCRHRGHRQVLCTATALAIAAMSSSAFALNTATGMLGLRIDLLRGAPYNLSGNGVTIGQVEGGRPGDPQVANDVTHPDVNPGSAGTPVGVFQVNAAGNGLINPPTAITWANTGHGTGGLPNDAHATAGAGAMISTNVNFRGASPSANLFAAAIEQIGGSVATGSHMITGFETVRGQGAVAINFSYGIGNGGGTNALSLESMYVDWVSSQQDTLVVQAGPEQFPPAAVLDGSPDDAYNCLVIGMTQTGPGGRYDRIQNSAGAIGLGNTDSDAAGAARINMHLVAPGNIALLPTIDNNGDGRIGGTAGGGGAAGPDSGQQNYIGTSFAAPLTTGVVALMRQHAAAQGLGTGHLVDKAVLMNSSSKHLRNRAGLEWVNSNAPTSHANPAAHATPLDTNMGVGQLNAAAAARQYQPVANDMITVRTGNIQNGSVQYQVGAGAGGQVLNKGSLVTATLVWDRTVRNNAVGAGSLLGAGNYIVDPFQNLNVRLVNVLTNQTVAASMAATENHEHIYFNVREDGRYRLEVVNATAGANQPFALAWASGTTDGLAFSVRPGAVGVRPTAVNNYDKVNDVNSLGQQGPAAYQTQGEIFVTGEDGQNMLRLSGALQTRSRVGPFNGPPAAMSLLTAGHRGVLGLQAGETIATTDQLADFSWGTDGTLLERNDPKSGVPGILVFSVQTSSDLRKSMQLDPFGQYISPPTTPANPNTFQTIVTRQQIGLDAADDLDAVELDSPIRGYDLNLQPVDRDGDGMHNDAVFFALGDASPSLAGARTADDVFVSRAQDPNNTFDLAGPGGGFAFDIFAEGATLGLQVGDAIDALVLSDVNRDGLLQAGQDQALFSVAPGGASGLDPGAVYETSFSGNFTLFATAAQLGIAGENLDALDILSVPEPSSSAMALVMIGGAMLRRRARSRT